MIRVLHVTEDHSARNTGISSAVDALTRCVPAGIEPAIACVGTEVLPVRAGLRLHILPTSGLAETWRWAPGCAARLDEAIAQADLVQLHGVWMWAQWAAARQALRQKKPFVLTAHGMLQPWMWRRQSLPHRLKKVLYWRALAFPAFRHAAAFHALTEQEAGMLAGFFPGKSPLLIPHGIDLVTADRTLAELPPATATEAPYLLFLGRLHPGKGIHLLLRAFARLPGKTLRLKLAGPTQEREAAYAASLPRLADELGLAGRVDFCGAVVGAEKWRLYRDAWAFCLPSFSEVIGLVNLEAAAARTPVITTFESGLNAEWERRGGLLIHPEEEALLVGLRQALDWTQAERDGRGRGLRALVETHYSWAQVGAAWAGAYQDLLERAASHRRAGMGADAHPDLRA